MTEPGTLHMLCGKIAAGKSTLARSLAAAPGVALISQDHLLSRLYPQEIATVQDFAKFSGRLREAIGPLVVTLLKAGVSVVMDFEANTPHSRAGLRSLFEAAAAPHELHWLDADDATCLERLQRRNAEGSHEYQVSAEVFAAFTAWFSAPAPEEGFNLRRIGVRAVRAARRSPSE